MNKQGLFYQTYLSCPSSKLKSPYNFSSCCPHWYLHENTRQKMIKQSYYSTIAPFYHIRAKERAKYATLLHCKTGQKFRLKRREKMAAQNKPNFALFTCKAQKFSMLSLVTFSILTSRINDTLMVSLVLFMSFVQVWISKTKSQNTRKWRNGDQE